MPGDHQLCAQMWDSGALSLAAGTGGTEGSAPRERSRGPAGRGGGRCLSPSAGGRGQGSGFAMVQLSPGKTPARGGEAGHCRGQREQRRPAAGCSHGKTHQGAGAGAAGEGGAARARQPGHPRGPAGAGRLSASVPRRSSRVEAEAGKTKCRAGRAGPGTESRSPHASAAARRPARLARPVLSAAGRVATRGAHAALHTAPWQLRRPAAAGRQGARAHPAVARTRVPRRAHCTRDRLHARAPRHASQAEGRKASHQRGRNRCSLGRSPGPDTKPQKRAGR